MSSLYSVSPWVCGCPTVVSWWVLYAAAIFVFTSMMRVQLMEIGKSFIEGPKMVRNATCLTVLRFLFDPLEEVLVDAFALIMGLDDQTT